MNHDDAKLLASRIHDIWPTGLRERVWRSELARDYSDALRSRQAVEILKRTKTYPPTIADFHAAYLSVPAEIEEGEARCSTCSGLGWIDAPDYERNGETYSAMQPCGRCRDGQRSARINARINAERALVEALTTADE